MSGNRKQVANGSKINADSTYRSDYIEACDGFGTYPLQASLLSLPSLAEVDIMSDDDELKSFGKGMAMDKGESATSTPSTPLANNGKSFVSASVLHASLFSIRSLLTYVSLSISAIYPISAKEKTAETSSSSSSSSSSCSASPFKRDPGRWTNEEHILFLQGLSQHGKSWKKISEVVKTRTVVQIRTHAQKYLIKLEKAKRSGHQGVLMMNGKTLSIEEERRVKKARQKEKVKEGREVFIV